MTFSDIILSACLSASFLLAGRGLIHYFQLESYQFLGYFRSVRRNLLKSVTPGILMEIVWIGTIIASAWLIPPDHSSPAGALAVGAVMMAAGWLISRFIRDHKAKKPLAFTARIKRLYGIGWAALTLFIMLLLRGAASAYHSGTDILSRIPMACVLILPVFLPLLIALAGLISWPVEKGISECYFQDARRILDRRNDLIRIGITGSWGKTSVKFILGTLLEEKYHTLITPASYNTPMGVTKVIRGSLEPGHRVFVAEMGARHVGDIKEMCRLVKPHMGILTSVGPQHLDTFKTLERVKKTKYELMDAVPENGMCFFADDEDICRELYEGTRKPRMLAGTDAARDDVWAEDIMTTTEGSCFNLCTREGKTPCETTLLGELNIRNIVLCAAVCLHLGLTTEEIRRGIRKLKPVEHRLQLIPNPGGMTVIDDAFNSNIRGAEQAFRVLSTFNRGKRIVVTPGMVELGQEEEAMNRRFGETMAGCCDAAILVGKKRSEAIRKGMENQGFDPGHIHVAASLDEATEMLKKMIVPGDIVLFENDLPDNYSE